MSCQTTAHQSSKLLTGYCEKVKDHTQSENLLDQKRQLRTNQSSDIIQVIENTGIYDGQRYTLNRRRHGTDGMEKSYWTCTVSGCKARFVLHDQRVKNSPLQSTQPWRPTSRTNSAQSQGSTEEQSSYI